MDRRPVGGLIARSFVPPVPIQMLRDLKRTRKQLVREIARHTLGAQKMLEDENVKLTRRGHRYSGPQRLGGSCQRSSPGKPTPERLAACTTGRPKADRTEIVAAVHGGLTEQRPRCAAER